MEIENLSGELKQVLAVYLKGESLTDNTVAERLFYHHSVVTPQINQLMAYGFLGQVDVFFDEETYQHHRVCAVKRGYVKRDSLGEFMLMWEKWAHCSKCSLPLGMRRRAIGAGNLNAKLCIIGNGPGRKEDMSGKPFDAAGSVGRELRKYLRQYGFDIETEVFLTNIAACRSATELLTDVIVTAPPTAEQTTACLPRLQEILRIVYPKLIVFVGDAHQYFFARPVKAFPIFVQGVSFYVSPDFDTLALDNPERPKAVKAMDTCWLHIRKAYDDAFEADEPSINWTLPLVAKIDK